MMSAAAENAAPHIPIAAPERVIVRVEPGAAPQATPSRASRGSDIAWMIPFFMVLVGALGLFLWQMSVYTDLTG